MVCSHASRGCAFVVATVLLLALQGLSASPGGLLASPAPPPALRPVSTDLAITNLTASPTPVVMVGTNSTYTIDFRNNGPDAAGNASAKLPTPTDTTFVSASVLSGTGWNLSFSPAVGGTGTWSSRTLGPGKRRDSAIPGGRAGEPVHPPLHRDHGHGEHLRAHDRPRVHQQLGSR